MRHLTNFDLVRDFHDKFNLDVDAPFSDSLLELRNDLIQEEAEEVFHEIYFRDGLVGYYIRENVDKEKLTKELVDLLYVVYGTGVAFGLPLDAAFRIVHESNMSKLGEDGKPIYREDGKVLKGPDYKPADLSALFKEIV